jgi:hypothetical protein
VRLRFVGEEPSTVWVGHGTHGGEQEVHVQPGEVYLFQVWDAQDLLRAEPCLFERITLHEVRPIVGARRTLAEDVARARAAMRPRAEEVIHLRLLRTNVPPGHDGATYTATLPPRPGESEAYNLTWKAGDVHPVPRSIAVGWLAIQAEAEERKEPGLTPAYFEVVDDPDPPIVRGVPWPSGRRDS